MTPEANAVATSLLSPGPHPELLPEQQIFAPFIGSWDLLVTWYGVDGRVAWRSTWIGPTQRAIDGFIARRIGEEVVLEAAQDRGRRMRWVFSDITPEGFTWRNYRETDQGLALTQDFQARRSRSQ
jgi:hypothetical protein